jgi:transcription initiation factor IIF auxiliary subunit
VNFSNYIRKVGKRGENDWYEWRVFVEDGEDVLDKIDHVEYLLHPTFPNPRRLVYDRQSRFALNGSGWGQFTIKIRVTYSNGEAESTSYFLDFNKSWP